MKEENKSYIWIFLIGWLCLNWLQAYLTELDPDEAYYWMYSKALDWGYFDHPPMVALFIKAGYSMIPNELGVRLFFPLAQVFSFWGIWKLAGAPKGLKELNLLFALLLAMPLFAIYGFVATPDGPLLLFSVLFLLAYQRFNNENSLINTALLGACMALLLYSKYHGVLLILFVLLADLSLLRKPQFYIASLFGAMLFFPHLYWQYVQDFPSFRYHLSGRDDIYEIKYTITYVINQLVVFSPLLFPLIVQALMKIKPAHFMEKTYLYLIYGFWIFFFFSSFKGHAEPQWTGILTIPIVLLLFKFGQEFPEKRKWILRMAGVSFVLLLLVRILLLWNFLGIKSEFHNREWVDLLKEKVDGKPVYFENSYRDASKYAFYSGDSVFAFTNVDYRKSQFDLWSWETNLQNREAIVVINKLWDCKDCSLEQMGRRTVKLVDAKELQVSNQLQVELANDLPEQVQTNQRIQIDLNLMNQYAFPVRLEYGNFPLQLSVFFLDQGALFSAQKVSLEQLSIQLVPGSNPMTVEFTIPDSLDRQRSYQFGVGFNYAGLPPSVSSDLHRLTLQK